MTLGLFFNTENRRFLGPFALGSTCGRERDVLVSRYRRGMVAGPPMAPLVCSAAARPLNTDAAIITIRFLKLSRLRAEDLLASAITHSPRGSKESLLFILWFARSFPGRFEL
jgi:hypothetical protein